MQTDQATSRSAGAGLCVEPSTPPPIADGGRDAGPVAPRRSARNLARFLCDLFTEADGRTFDLKRALWALGVVWFMACETYAIARGQPFDPQGTAVGLGGLIAAGGAAIAMNRRAELPTGDGA